MKGYRDNASGAGGFGARSKTVYDDVFGGPPKFGATTLPPRIEDYTEIFQGFHASRGSSIPVLDLPPPAVNSDDVWFDVSSSKLDYSEVFGGFNGLDFAYSYEELFESSKVAEDDSSDDVWTPAQSESLSEESDLQASLETNQQVFTADLRMDLKTDPNFEADKDYLNEMTDDSQRLDVSGFGVLDNQVLPTKTENDNYFSLVNNNIYASKDFGQAAEEKKLKKSLSGLSLKTQPSNLPPPSRPPPGLTLKKGDFGNFTSKLKTSKSYAFDRMTVDPSPPFFDVEIDASSSAAADAAAMKDAVEQAQAKLKSAKALMDRKKKVKENDFEGEKMKRLFKSGSGRNENQQNHQNAVISEPNVGSTESKHNSETVEETVENEMFENLIEIQLKDNDIVTMEKVVTKTWFKDDDNEIKGDEMGPACNMWVDYDIQPEEATEKTEEQYEKILKAGPLAMSSIHGEESDNISETVSEETLDHDEKMLSAEERIKTEIDEKIETIYEVDCNLEENLNLRESVFENESVKWDEDESITGENLEEERETERLRILEKERETERLRKLEEERENERLRRLEERENERLRRLEERENERLRKVEEHETERLRKLEEEQENERLRKLEKERENERLRKLEEEREFERLQKLEEEREAERLRKLEKERETERLRKLEEECETERLRKLEEERENERLRKLEEERETERLRKLEEERETERLRKLEEERETERLRKLEKERETERLRREEERENERLRKLEKERETERLRKLEEERETERLKLEEERERQIEREKDRMAVDRATLEAREKTFAETRERATIERATAEFRQRALAEARERLEKACAEARERSLADKAMEGRLRVEKATAEARERAVSDKFPYQNAGIRQNSLPSDLSGSYSGLRYYQAPTQGVGEDESPQRCKARLERHQRTADRAAKALAEKNMRDLIAQKEQAERSRLAEGLDAEVKRWSSGKQGNLRALLSTLQYILGPDSGWQPVPLTEVITTAAVKKAYRKATLCVHPDKLQQRGATIQQKYVCEKVFDLLKEAWNKFNSEER